MAESKILNNAARVLKLVQTGTPADQALRESLTQDRHYTAPGERRGISRAVFTYFRWWRWLAEKDSPQKQLAAALALQDRFDKNPASFKAEALTAWALPDWIKSEMDQIPPGWVAQLQREPALWIRTRQGLQSRVTGALGNCFPPAAGFTVAGVADPGPVSSPGSSTPATVTPTAANTAFRYTGITDLYRTPGFQEGDFEIQDLASQLVSLAANPAPGQTWWDACAGEGGKTMHLSDLMQNKGVLWASDRSLRRLTKLKERAARAKVFNFRSAPWEGGVKLPTKTKFDGVLVDAPCSGVGTWQRNPHARWTTQPLDVRELAAVQTRLLDHVAPSLKASGRLVYAVCTLTRAETTAIADSFTAGHPEFEPAPVFGSELPVPRSQLTLWPQDLNANGMFIAAWKKK